LRTRIPCCAPRTADFGETTPGAFGPRLQALIAIFSGEYRLSKRKIKRLLKDLFGITISLGAVAASEQAVSEALKEPVEKAHEYAQNQEVAYVDETGWRERNAKSYLWTMCTAFITIFMIGANRNRELAKKLLGKFKGVLVTDRLKTYEHWPMHRHQFCWAHLIRRFEEFLLNPFYFEKCSFLAGKLPRRRLSIQRRERQARGGRGRGCMVALDPVGDQPERGAIR